MTIGKLISARRKVLRMTQYDLAVLIGVSKSAVAKWETDRGVPDRVNLQRLSEVINVPLEQLYRSIDSSEIQDVDLKVNITPDVIALLESFGYKVIRPGEEDEGLKED